MLNFSVDTAYMHTRFIQLSNLEGNPREWWTYASNLIQSTYSHEIGIEQRRAVHLMVENMSRSVSFDHSLLDRIRWVFSRIRTEPQLNRGHQILIRASLNNVSNFHQIVEADFFREGFVCELERIYERNSLDQSAFDCAAARLEKIRKIADLLRKNKLNNRQRMVSIQDFDHIDAVVEGIGWQGQHITPERIEALAAAEEILDRHRLLRMKDSRLLARMDSIESLLYGLRILDRRGVIQDSDFMRLFAYSRYFRDALNLLRQGNLAEEYSEMLIDNIERLHLIIPTLREFVSRGHLDSAALAEIIAGSEAITQGISILNQSRLLHNNTRNIDNLRRYIIFAPEIVRDMRIASRDGIIRQMIRILETGGNLTEYNEQSLRLLRQWANRVGLDEEEFDQMVNESNSLLALPLSSLIREQMDTAPSLEQGAFDQIIHQYRDLSEVSFILRGRKLYDRERRSILLSNRSNISMIHKVVKFLNNNQSLDEFSFYYAAMHAKKVIKALDLLGLAKIDSVERRNLLFKHVRFVDRIYRAMEMLWNKNKLNDREFDMLMMCVKAMQRGFSILHRAGLYSDFNKKGLMGNILSGSRIVECMKILESAHLLTQKRFDSILHHSFLLNRILTILLFSDLLNEENVNRVFSRLSEGDELVKRLTEVSQAKPLDQITFDRIFK